MTRTKVFFSVIFLSISIPLCVRTEVHQTTAEQTESSTTHFDTFEPESNRTNASTTQPPSKRAGWSSKSGSEEADASNSPVIADSITAEGHHSQGRYLPPPTCHPCNHEPWVPVDKASIGHGSGGPNAGHSQGHHHNGQYAGGFNNFVNSFYDSHKAQAVYGPPPKFSNPKPPSFKTPKLIRYNQEPPFAPPPSQAYGPPPSQAYGPPPQQQAYALPARGNGGPVFSFPKSSFPNEYLSPPVLFEHGHNRVNSNSVKQQQTFFLGSRPENKFQGHYKPFSAPPPSGGGNNNFNLYKLPLPVQNNFAQVTNPDYLAPKEHQQLPLSNGAYDMFHDPMRTSYGYQEFGAIPQHIQPSFGRDANYAGSAQNIQIQQSIPVAEFLASVDHPIKVIQSPLTEVQYAPDPETLSSSIPLESVVFDGAAFQQHSSINNFAITVPSAATSGFYGITAGAVDGYAQPSSNVDSLSQNPIVVEDVHGLESVETETFVSVEQPLSTASPVFSFSPSSSSVIASPTTTSTTAPRSYFQYHTTPTHRSTSSQLPNGFSSYEVNLVSEQSRDIPRIASINPALRNRLENHSKQYVNTKLNWTQPDTSFRESQRSKAKQIQIVIPYTKSAPAKTKAEYTKHRKSPQLTSFGSKLPNTLKLVSQPRFETTSAPPIRLPSSATTINGHSYNNLPFDIINFQKNIDGWTEEEYTKTERNLPNTGSTKKSKQIPEEFLTTTPYDELTTLPLSDVFGDHEGAATNHRDVKLLNDELQNNFVRATTTETSEDYSFDLTSLPNEGSTGTTSAGTTLAPTVRWTPQLVTVSPITNEKIYVVTPETDFLGKNAKESGGRNATVNPVPYSSDKFSIQVNSKHNEIGTDDVDDNVRIVLSEWPHLINNLETTTSTQASTTVEATTKVKVSTTSRSPHPLFGLMDLSSYTLPPGSTVQTYSGHSKIKINKT